MAATIPEPRVVAPISLDGLQVKASIMDPIPQWAGLYMHLVGPYLDGGFSC
jgi:hypothetical protein